MTETLQNALVSAVVGGAFGAIAGLASKLFLAAWQRQRLYSKLQVYVRPLHSNNGILRAVNGYVLPLTSCWAYMSLDYQNSDIVSPPGAFGVHINRERPLDLHEDRLCWSALFHGRHSPVVDIYSHEHQALTVFKYHKEGNCIGIASESMFEIYRVFLKADKVYRGTLKIVSKETKAKVFQIKIDMQNQAQPLSIRPISCWFDPADNW